jgi:hypothetical protein
MNLFRKLVAVVAPNEDEGYNDHMVGQTQGPFYCGTAFCGHSTKKAARDCWQRKRDACEEQRKAGKNPYDDSALYPERDPKNWPINRSSAAMQAEYIERAKKEAAQ